MSSSFLLVGGGFQDSGGIPLAGGRLIAKLSSDCYVVATGQTQLICAGSYEDDGGVSFILDEDGDVSTDPPQEIFPNDLLTSVWANPQLSSPGNQPDNAETFYTLAAYTESGQLAWGPNSIYLFSSQGVPFAFSQFSFGDAGTEYLLSFPPVADSVFVYVNGLQDSDITVSGSVVTLGFTPAFTDVVAFTYYTNPVPGISPVFEQEIPTGSETTFILSHTPLSGTVALYRNGLLQTPGGVDYTILGTVITLTSDIGSDDLYSIYQTSETFTTTVQETPSGDTNGTNKTFVLSQPCEPGSLQVFVNGVYEIQTNGGSEGYTLASDGRTITLPVAPSPGDAVRAIYSLNLNILNLNTVLLTNPY